LISHKFEHDPPLLDPKFTARCRVVALSYLTNGYEAIVVLFRTPSGRTADCTSVGTSSSTALHHMCPVDQAAHATIDGHLCHPAGEKMYQTHN
jgi:hypothetical protein